MTNEINRMTKEFLNEELKQFCELTREEKHLLLDAVLDANCQVFDEELKAWRNKETVAVSAWSVYRTKPKEYKKLNIPWQFIKPVFKYAAMDNDGDIWVYEFTPVFESCGWDWRAGELAKLNVLEIDTTDVIPEHSLAERPEGV